VIVLTPLALILSLFRSATVITVSTTMATCIMYISLITILYLVFSNFNKPMAPLPPSKSNVYYQGGSWGPSAELDAAATTRGVGALPGNQTRWDYVQVWPEHVGDLPIVFGNLLYTVTTAVGILLPIENAMKISVRGRYINVVYGAILCALVLFLMVGILSNLAFGRHGARV
jgi:hypothetical protein